MWVMYINVLSWPSKKQKFFYIIHNKLKYEKIILISRSFMKLNYFQVQNIDLYESIIWLANDHDTTMEYTLYHIDPHYMF